MGDECLETYSKSTLSGETHTCRLVPQSTGGDLVGGQDGRSANGRVVIEAVGQDERDGSSVAGDSTNGCCNPAKQEKTGKSNHSPQSQKPSTESFDHEPLERQSKQR